MISKISLGIFGAWFCLVVIGLYVSMQTSQSPFDPEYRLANASGVMDFDTQLATQFLAQYEHTANTVFHIQQGDCRCNIYSEQHIRILNNLGRENQLKSKVIDISTAPWLRDWIPSVPAIVVFNETSRLAYLGPYAPGPFCAVADSFVDNIIKTLNTNEYLGAVIIHDTQGCYCNL
ncbi:hypothetical protein DRW07_05750 [Alteromonas sediminis]|uniref:DUF6436 domain-containing protein n=1 Tax=Alteromonas sediminis TaxID=2259342 RepID=A0A3N5ZBM6_9ALTE|nr:DUF6436 domain-containing protein [Alteromonas sediminis]RPJ67048.1 hypothetical protein DRW07_05750 [Alteromonas sediminis]